MSNCNCVHGNSEYKMWISPECYWRNAEYDFTMLHVTDCVKWLEKTYFAFKNEDLK